MKERIKEIRVSSSLTQEAFASRIGLTKSAISNIESGNRSPSEPVVRSICREFNVNYDWLTQGEGEMRTSPQEEEKALLASVFTRGNDFQRNIVLELLRLPDDKLAEIEAFWRRVLDKPQTEEQPEAHPSLYDSIMSQAAAQGAFDPIDNDQNKQA